MAGKPFERRIAATAVTTVRHAIDRIETPELAIDMAIDILAMFIAEADQGSEMASAQALIARAQMRREHGEMACG